MNQDKIPDENRVRSDCLSIALFFLVLQDMPFLLAHTIMFKGIDCANYYKIGEIFWSALVISCIFVIIGIHLEEGCLLLPWIYLEPVSWVMKCIPLFYYYVSMKEESVGLGVDTILGLIVISGFILWGLYWVNIVVCVHFHACIRILYDKYTKPKIVGETKDCSIL